MKYRVLTPEEMEAYKIGYKVGARELFITGQEWESEEEHRIYRKGYNAGCKDRERKNLKPELLDKCQQCQQCQQCLTCDSQDSQDCVYPIVTVIDTDTVTDTVTDKENKGGVGGKETIDTNARKNATDALLNKMAQSFKAPPMNATQIGKTPIPPAMKQFIESEFTPAEITRLKWWLAENKSGEVMKNESILRAACTIANKKYPDVFARFLRFGIN